jgi:hypothetical protein
MIQGSEQSGFTLESGKALFVFRESRGEDLDGYVTIKLGVSGEIDLPHSTFADLLDDPVMRESSTNHGGPPR